MSNGDSKIEITANDSIAGDIRASPAQAWTPRQRIKIKTATVIGLVGCAIGLFSLAGLCVPMLRHNSLKMALFGDNDVVMEKGIIQVLLEKSKENFASLEKLTKWANGTLCLPGSGFIYKDNCYRHGPRVMTYDMAEKYCKLRGGLLAFFRSEEELEIILQHLWNEGYGRRDEIWVGITQIDEEWVYSNGDKAAFTKWARGNVFDDGFNCAQLRTEPGDNRAGYYDRQCSDSQEFLCIFPI